MKSTLKNIDVLLAVAIACVAIAGCGNKGPLVKPSDVPAPTPAAVPAAAEPVAEPDTAPAAEATPAAEPASGTPAARR